MLLILMLLSITAVYAEDNQTLLSEENVVEENVVEEVCEVESNGFTTQESSGSIVNEDLSDDDSEVTDNKANSTITASNVKGYDSFTTTMNVKLTADSTPLSSKKLQIKLNGVTYNKSTDSNGEVKLNLKLNKGVYTAEITYFGDDLTSDATKSCKVTIVSPIKTKLKMNSLNHMNILEYYSCLNQVESCILFSLFFILSIVCICLFNY